MLGKMPFRTRETANSVRDIIEFTQVLEYIPRDLAGKVIGREGKLVQQILEKSKLNNIKVIGDQEAKDRKLNTNDVPFELVGRRKAIDNAKMMLDYHLDHLREVDSILKEREEITQKLRNNGLDEPPSFYPRPNPTRGRGRGRNRQSGGPNRRPGRQQRREDKDTGQSEDDDQQTQPMYRDRTNEGDGEGEETDSTEEEQQRHEENMKRADSPLGDGNGVSPSRKRANKGYRRRRRNKNREGPRPTVLPTENEHNDDWPSETHQEEEEKEEQHQPPEQEESTNQAT